MPLARKHGGQAPAPQLLHGGEDAQLVIDHDVVIGRKAPLDGIQHLLLVQVNEDSAVYRVPQARALHLARLENHIAVGEDDRGSETPATRERCQRTRIEPVRERVVHQEERHPQQLRIVEVLQAIALQSAEIVGVTELRAQLFENRPVAVAARAAELALQMGAEIGLHGVVVEERIVHVEQEHDFRRRIRHPVAPMPLRQCTLCFRSAGAGPVNPADRSAFQRSGVVRTEDSGMNIESFVSSVRTRSRRRRLLACTGVGVLLGALASCRYGSNYSLPTIDVPNAIAIADVDSDGTPDLLLATTADQGNAHNPGFANVILGNHGTPGTFHTGVTYPTTGNDPSSIAVADLTRSGSLD